MSVYDQLKRKTEYYIPSLLYFLSHCVNFRRGSLVNVYLNNICWDDCNWSHPNTCCSISPQEPLNLHLFLQISFQGFHDTVTRIGRLPTATWSRKDFDYSHWLRSIPLASFQYPDDFSCLRFVFHGVGCLQTKTCCRSPTIWRTKMPFWKWGGPLMSILVRFSSENL